MKNKKQKNTHQKVIERNLLLFVLVHCLTLWSLACETTSEETVQKSGKESSAGGDADGDTDSDTDSDSDGDSDADADANSNQNDNGSGEVVTKDSINECAGVTEDAQSVRLPADIIIAVDNSGSMVEEAGFVRKNINRLSERVEELDVHIVLVTARNGGDVVPAGLGKIGNMVGTIVSTFTPGICVDPPLGKEGACPDEDESNPPKFKHINRMVNSNDGLQAIVQTYSQWKDSLREGAPLHIVLVSDDNSNPMTADGFINNLSGRTPPIEDFTFHAIVATSNPGNGGPCNTLAAAKGTVYEELVQKTRGVLGNLCEQKFDPVFDAISDSMLSSALSCEWKIPTPPEGETFDTSKVNVQFKNNANDKVHNIGWVPNKEACAKVENGWYYNKEKNPTKVIVCEQTCDWIQSKEEGSITITFGCETIPATIV